MRLARFLQRNMARRRRPARALRAVVLAGAVGLVGAGCETGINPEKSFLDPSELSGRTGAHQNDPLIVPVLDAIEPAIEAPDQMFVNATEPTAQDLVNTAADYRISPNDYLGITITDLVPGVETQKQTRVTQTGNISLPFMRRPLRAAGKTEIELERAIADEYRAEDIVRDAQVTVTTIEARGRTFTVQGAIQRVGQYPIVETDFRLLNALMTAGGTTTQFANTAYVIRSLNQGPQDTSGGGGGAGTTAPTGEMPPMRPGRATTGPAAEDLAPGNPGGATRPGATGNDLAPAGGAAAVPDVALPDEPAARVTTIDGQQLPVQTTTTTPGTPSSTTGTGAAGAMSPTGATGGTSPGEMTGGAMSGSTTTDRPGEAFAFNAPREPTNVRVIRVPLDRLKRGELKYNIAIRPGDQIVIPEPEVGVYYMGGHVGAPGAFTLAGGQKVTLMDAVISARMLDSLAIPQRTDIVRRLDDNRQVFIRVDLAKIFEGIQPDLYMKPNDKVLVGTSVIAPFLAATRGAFRITYGFGFLYDRNFALESGTQNF